MISLPATADMSLASSHVLLYPPHTSTHLLTYLNRTTAIPAMLA